MKFRLCKGHNRLNLCTVKARLHGCLVAQLEGAILDFLKARSAHVQMVKTLTKVKIKPCFVSPV